MVAESNQFQPGAPITLAKSVSGDMPVKWLDNLLKTRKNYIVPTPLVSTVAHLEFLFSPALKRLAKYISVHAIS